MTFLLDANVLLDFQNANLLGALVRASSIVPMVVVEQVFDEVTRERPTDSSTTVGKKRAAATVLSGCPIGILEILPGTAEARLMRALTPIPSTKDLGEAASIAVARSNPDLVFVTGDKNGVLVALNELYGTGERILRIPVFVRRLFELSALDVESVHGVSKYALSHGLRPSWWDDWAASPRTASDRA